ncbi:MAG TPA: phosphoribosylglycinamide formyltransferase [Caulobacteraceae bacterium]|nr:phosphoribosylglycinamide formyltransferase [Caulobacteraceae bacterium]
MPTPLRLGFLASHAGSSMRAIVGAIQAGELEAAAAIVISNNAGAAALEFARANGVSERHISARTAGSDAEADRLIAAALVDAEVNLVVLSGYLRMVGPLTLARYQRRILNIHPALLPKYGGKGMYGHFVHEAVLSSGDAVSGASVHLVDEEYDHGPVLSQKTVPIVAADTVDTLRDKVIALEGALFVETLRTIVAGGGEIAL